MASLNDDLQFVSFVQEILNDELECNLTFQHKEIVENISLIVSLYDIEKSTFIEIQYARLGTVNEKKFEFLQRTIDEIKSEHYQKKFVVVFNEKLSKDDRNYFNQLVDFQESELLIYDTEDLNEIARNLNVQEWKTEEELESEEFMLDGTKKLLGQGINFFAVGHIWGNDNQIDRFIEYGIWENGYDDKWANSVNLVSVGDVLILKASFSVRNK